MLDGSKEAGENRSGPREVRRSPRQPPSSASYWLLTRERERFASPYPEIFASRHGSTAPVLPVFSSEAEARALLGAPGEEGGWRTREATAGELISVLSASGSSGGPCAGVEKVALDPPPEILDKPELLALLTVGRQRFLDSLMGRGHAWSEAQSWVKDERRSVPAGREKGGLANGYEQSV